MNPLTLQAMQIMLSIVISDKEGVTKGMKSDALKVINNLMHCIQKDSDTIYREYSSFVDPSSTIIS